MQHYRILRALSSVVILTITLSVTLLSQGRGPFSEGTDFVVAFMNLMNEATEKPLPQPLQLYISSHESCTVSVQANGSDATKIDRTLYVGPDNVTRLSISYPNYITGEHGKVVDNGIRVRSTAPISVSSIIQYSGNGELLHHLPTTSWGTRYRTFNLYQDRFGSSAGNKYRPSQVVLISGSDSTVVEIRTKYALKSGGPDVDSIGPLTYRVKMNADQRVYLEWAIDESLTKDWASDPTGTLITANKPIAVLSGHTKGAIMRYPDMLPPTGMYMAQAHFVRNCMQDVMLPESMAGTEFLTVPIRYDRRKTGEWPLEYGVDDDRGDVIRFIALEDNTILSVHRQDGTGYINVASLDEGEVHTSSVVENASLWRATKPVLCMQYGKSWAMFSPNKKDAGNGSILGHPTVESGLPMMQAVPSIDRWIDKGKFHSPEGNDNFVNIVFRTEDSAAIELDGALLPAKYGKEIKKVAGTEYSSARILISLGIHNIRAVQPNVRFMAWTYGSLDGMMQGRAYGAPVGIDLTDPCNDTIEIMEDLAVTDCPNGVFAASVRVRSGVEGCGRVQSISLINANNLMLNGVPAIGSTSSSYVVRAGSTTRRAFGTVRIMTTAGTYEEIEYNFEPATYSVSEIVMNFGAVPVNEQRCTTLTINNVSYEDTLVIAEIVAKPSQSVFSVTPSQAVLAPRKSLVVTVCARPTASAAVVDTIFARMNCGLRPLVECTVAGAVSPAINVSDASWDVPPGDRWHTRSFKIENTGTNDLVVSDMKWKIDPAVSTHFRLDSQLPSFPFVIEPQSSNSYSIAFNPLNETDMAARAEIVVSSNAARADSVAILIGKTSPTSTVAEHGEQPLSVSPQPLNLSEHGVLTVFIKDAVNSVSIADPVGRMIYGSISDGPVRIPASAFPSAGMYVLLLETSEGVARIPVMCIE